MSRNCFFVNQKLFFISKIIFWYRKCIFCDIKKSNSWYQKINLIFLYKNLNFDIQKSILFLMTLWSLTNSDFPTNQTFHQFHDLDTELDLHRLWVVSIEHLQRVWHASRERLPFRTPGSVAHFCDLLMLQLLRPNSSNLPCLYSTFHLEYPLVLSRFCFDIKNLRYSYQEFDFWN